MSLAAKAPACCPWRSPPIPRGSAPRRCLCRRAQPRPKCARACVAVGIRAIAAVPEPCCRAPASALWGHPTPRPSGGDRAGGLACALRCRATKNTGGAIMSIAQSLASSAVNVKIFLFNGFLLQFFHYLDDFLAGPSKRYGYNQPLGIAEQWQTRGKCGGRRGTPAPSRTMNGKRRREKSNQST